MEEWELRLGLADAEDLVGQSEEGGFPGTTQIRPRSRRSKSSLLLGTPSAQSTILFFFFF